MNRIGIFAVLITLHFATTAQPTVIGHTTYDIQTSSGSKNRLHVSETGTISAAWLGSESLAASFNDRGTFLNLFNGATWATLPTSRAEGMKVNSSEVVVIDGHEVIISSDGSKIIIYKNSATGADDWVQTAGSNQIDGTAPMAFAYDGSNYLFVVNVGPGATPSLQFSLSSDAGESWDVLEYALPYLSTADGISTILAEYYSIAAYSADVYILYGAPNTDLKVLYSGSLGYPGTWSEIPILDFPIDNYSGGLGQSTDFDADGIPDTILTTDGSHELIMSDDGIIYLFSGATKIYDGDPATPGWNSIPQFGGFHFWKIGLGEAEFINTVVDWKDPDGLGDPYAGIGQNFSAYGADGFCTMPSASIDPTTGSIYLVYCMPVEYTDAFGDPENPNAQSRSDLFGLYSNNFGDTWSAPVNLTYSAFTGIENAYPTLAQNTFDNKVHVIWMQDEDPGVYTDSPPDPIHENDIVYQAFPFDRFDPYVPSPNFIVSVNALGGGLYNAVFTNLSQDAESYSWNFGDGDNSVEANPSHIYTEGVFNACLTASNVYGTATYCSEILSVSLPSADFSFSGDPTVAFTDLSTGGITNWSWDFGDGSTSATSDPMHTYLSNDLFTACLTASNPLGSSSVCKEVEINNILPVAAFSFTGDPTVSFTDLSLNDPISWSWSFGDGVTSTESNPVHTYFTNDTYTVCLEVENIAGSNTICQPIEIDGYPAVTANFTNSGDPVVSFTDNSLNDPFSWFWDFDDGTISTETNPIHTYTENGTYFVCLTATGPGGTDNYCKFINIALANAVPSAGFSYSVLTGTELVFSDESINAEDWFWDFGDGGISGLQNPIHAFPSNGNYNVCLTATNDFGSDTHCNIINVNTSIQDMQSNGLRVYPNPANYQLTLSGLKEGMNYTITIVDLSGKVVQHSERMGSELILLPINDLTPGNYQLLIYELNNLTPATISFTKF